MYEKYSVEQGETLSSIAKKFNTLEETIKDINNLYDEEVRKGMEIVVPKEKENYFEFYKIENGDTLYKISKRYNINPDLLMTINGLEKDDYIYPDQTILIPKNGYSYYVTKEGDTLDIVADRFDVSINKLLSHNSVIYLLPGQLLVNKTKTEF